MVLQPMATDGKDAVWSMGDDTSIAPLARAPRPLYAFFRQRFAQVTNPPIDPLRETVVLQMHTRLGPWPHIFELREPLPGLSLRSPILSLGQMHALFEGHHPQAGKMPHAVLHCLYTPDTTLEIAVDILAAARHPTRREWRIAAHSHRSRCDSRSAPRSHGDGRRRRASRAYQGRSSR